MRDTRLFVRNHQNQPVELHLPSGIVVVGPRAEVEVQPTDVDAPQLRVLVSNRVLSCRRVEGEAAHETPKAPPERARSIKPKSGEKEA